MMRCVGVLLCVSVLCWMVACSATPGGPSTGVVVAVAGAFKTIEAGSQSVTLTASVSGDPHNQGVKWTLSVANTDCSPGCGTLKPLDSAPKVSAVYTPPATAPVNQLATITARSIADDHQTYVFNFQITPTITVSITPKFTTQFSAGPVVNLTATVQNDLSNSGVIWTLTAGSSVCSPQCGTLNVDPAPALTAHYIPPLTTPSGSAAMPTITASSIADPSRSDSFSFTITNPVIAVMILNKFSSVGVGAPSLTVSAVVQYDFTFAGVTWTLTSGGNPCSPACGTLSPSSAPNFSITYAPPSTLPAGADDSPTLTATSITYPNLNDGFSFTVADLSSRFSGNYAFQVRGFDTVGSPIAVSGSLISDGAGNITGGELDYTATATVLHESITGGSYVVDNSFNGIPRVTINIVDGPYTLAFKCSLSADGTRGKIIEYDGTLRLNAGTIAQQVTASLTAANAAGSYAFGLDSDAGSSSGGTVTGRIVEAGQFTLGARATGITGGIADAAQTGAAAVLLGTGTTPATISADVATAPDGSGRGTLTLTINGNSNQYAYYMVDGQQLDLIEIDSGGAFQTIQSGTAQKQKTLSASSVNAASVAALTGTSGGGTSVIVGVLTISGGTTASVNYEYNAAGNVPANQTPVDNRGNGTVSSFDPTTGRAAITNGFVPDVAVYLYDVGKGFMIDITQAANGNNQALSGPLMVQAQNSFASTDVEGNYIGLSGGSSTNAIPNIDFAANFDTSGGYSAVVDFTGPNLTVGVNGQAQNYYLAATYYGLTYQLLDTTLGRGMITFNAGVFDDFNTPNDVHGSFYMIGPRQFVAIGQGPQGTGVDPSGILFFDPQ